MSFATLLARLRAAGVPMTLGGSTIKANVAHRTGTVAQLYAAGDIASGEVAVATDQRRLVVGMGGTPLPVQMPAHPRWDIEFSEASKNYITVPSSGSVWLKLNGANGTDPLALSNGDTDILDDTDGDGFTLLADQATSTADRMFGLLTLGGLGVDCGSAVEISIEPRFDLLGSTDLEGSGFTGLATQATVLPYAGGSGMENLYPSSIQVPISGIANNSTDLTYGIRLSTDGTEADLQILWAFLSIVVWPVN